MPHGGPATGPCPSPAMHSHTQSSGPKPWPEGECGVYLFLSSFISTCHQMALGSKMHFIAVD